MGGDLSYKKADRPRASRAFFSNSALYLVVFFAISFAAFFGIPRGAHAEIVAEQLQNGGSTTAASTYTTASFTPQNNQLVLVWVVATKAAPAGAPTTVTTTTGLTFQQVTNIGFNTIASNGSNISLYRALVTSGATTGTITFGFNGVNRTGCAWTVVGFTGVDTSGTHGSGAIVQAVTDRANTTTSAGVEGSASGGLQIPLAALGNAGNTTAGGFSNVVNNASSIVGAGGYTSGTGANYGTPATSIRAIWSVTGTTDVNVTQSANSNIGGIAVEIKQKQITISGNVYSDKATTLIGTTPSVCAIVDGVAASKTCQTVSAGSYPAITVAAAADSNVVVFLDTNGGDRATTYTLSSGSNISDLHLYKNHLIMRHENAGPITATTLFYIDSTDDSDIIGTYSSGNVVNNVSTAQVITFYIPSGKTFTGASITPGGCACFWAVDIDGTMSLSGSFSSARDSFRVAGSFSSTGTTTFYGSNASISGGGSITFNGSLVLGASGSGNSNVTLSTSVYVGGTLSIASAPSFPNTVNLGNSILLLGGSGTPLVLNGMNFNADTSLVWYTQQSSTVTVAPTTYYSLAVGWSTSVNTFQLGGDTTVMNVAQIAASSGSPVFDFQSYELTLTGSGTPLLTNGETIQASSSTVNYQGTSTTTIAPITYGFLNLGAAGVGSGRTYQLGSQSMTVTEVLTVNAPASGTNTFDVSNGSLTFSLYGSPFVLNGQTFVSTGSTVNYTGATLGTNIVGTTYHHLNIGGAATTTTYTAYGDITVNGNLVIVSSSGANTFAGLTRTITVKGDWTNNGTFSAGTSTVNFAGVDGATQVIAGNTTFYNFIASTASNSTGRTLRFTAGTTQTVTNNWTITGFAGKVITLQSSAISAWTINPTTPTVTYVSVTYSTNTGATFCATFSSGGANTGWEISGGAVCTIVVSGTAYSNEGATRLSGGLTVRVQVNGAGGYSTTTSTTNCPSSPCGDFSVAVTMTEGQIVTAYLDTNGGARGVMVTRATGVSITSIGLYQNWVVLRNDDGTSISNTNLDQFDSGQDTDVPFDVTGTALVVDPGFGLHIWAGHTFAPGGAVTTQYSTPTLDGTIHLDEGATFTGHGDGVTIGGSLIEDAGAAFNPAAFSTTLFTAGTTGRTVAGATYPLLTFNNASGGWTLQGDVTIQWSMNITAGALNAGSNTLTINGCAGVFCPTNPIGVGGSGSVDFSSATVKYVGLGYNSGTVGIVGTTYGALEVATVSNTTSQAYALLGNTVVNGNLTLGTTDAQADTLQDGGFTLTIAGTGGMIRASGGAFSGTGTVSYTATSGTPFIGAGTYNNLNVGTAQDTNAGVTFYLGASVNPTVNGTLTVGNASSTNADTLHCNARTLTLTASGTPLVFASGGKGTLTCDFNSTISFEGTGATTVPGSVTYGNLSVGTNANGTITAYTMGGNATISGALTIGTAGSTQTDTFSDGGYTLTFSHSAFACILCSTSRGTYTGTGNALFTSQTVAYVNAATFNNVSFGANLDAVTTTWAAQGNIRVNGVMTIGTSNASYTDTFSLGSNTLTMGGTGSVFSITSYGALNVQTGTLEYANASGTANAYIGTYNNFLMSGTGIVQTTGTITVNGNITATAGTIDFGNQSQSVAGNVTATSPGQILGLSTISNCNGAGTLTMTGTSKTLGGTGITNLCSLNVNGTITMAGDVGANGNFTIQASKSLDASSNNYTLTIDCARISGGCTGGSFGIAPGGEFIEQSGTVVLLGSGSHSVSGNTGFHNLHVGTGQDSSAGATYSVGFPVGQATLIVTGEITIGNDLSTNTDTLNLGAHHLEMRGAGSPLNITSKGAYTSTTGGVLYTNVSANGATNIAATSYKALSLGTTSDVTTGVTYTLLGNTFAETVTVGNATSTNTDTLNDGGFTFTISGSGTPLNVTSRGAIVSTGTFNYTTALGNTTLAAATYGNLGVGTLADSVSVVYFLGGNTVVDGVVTIGNQGSGGGSIDTLSMGSSTLEIVGSGTSLNRTSQGNLEPGTGRVIYSSPTGATVTAETYYTLDVFSTGNSTFTLAGDIIVTGTGDAVRILGAFPSVATLDTAGHSVSITTGNLRLGSCGFGITGNMNAQSSIVTVAGNLIVNCGTLSGTPTMTVNGDVTSGASSSGVISLTGGTFEQRIGSAKNFGTDAGTSAWTFNNLTFSNSTTGALTVGAGAGTGPVNITGALSLGKTGDNASGTITLNPGNRIWTLSGTTGSPILRPVSTSSTLSAANGSTFVFTGNNAGGNTSLPVLSTWNNVTFDNGSETFTFSGAGTVTLSGDLTITAGTLSPGSINIVVGGGDFMTTGTFSGSSSNVTVKGSGSGTVGGSGSFTASQLVIGDNSTSSSVTAAGNLAILSLVITDSSTNGNVFNASNKTITLQGNSGSTTERIQVGAGETFTAGTSTVSMTANNSSGNVNVAPLTYYNLTIGWGGETYDLIGTTVVQNDLTLSVAADTLAGAQNLTVNGSMTGAGGLNLSGGTLTLNPGADEIFGRTSGSGSWTVNNLALRNTTESTTRTITLASGGTGSLIVNGTLTVGNSVAVGSALLVLDAETNDRILDANGDVSITSEGTLVASSSAALTVAGSWSNYGTFTSGTGTVTFDAGSAGKTLNGTLNDVGKFYNVTFNNASGGWTVVPAFEAANTLTITAGDVTFSDVVVLGGSVSNSGTADFTPGVFIVDDAGANTLNFGGAPVGSALFASSNNASWTFQGSPVTFAGDVLIGGGSINSSVNLTFQGDLRGWFLNSNGVINITNPVTVEMRPTTDVDFGLSMSFAPTWTFHNLTFSNGNGTATPVTITGPSGQEAGVKINGTLTVGKNTDTAGATTTLLMGNNDNIWEFAGFGTPIVVATNPTATLDPQTTTVQFSSNSGAPIPALTYYNLETTGPGDFVPTAGTLTINNDLTLTQGTFNLLANDPTLWVKRHFTIGNGTVFNASDVNQMTVMGNFTNNGSFAANLGTVYLGAEAPTSGSDYHFLPVVDIGGANPLTFHNLVTNIPGKTYRFQAEKTISIGGQWTAQGNNFRPIHIRSTATSGTPTQRQWKLYLAAGATAVVSHATVQDSGCETGGGNVPASPLMKNDGNNGICWTFLVFGGGSGAPGGEGVFGGGSGRGSGVALIGSTLIGQDGILPTQVARSGGDILYVKFVALQNGDAQRMYVNIFGGNASSIKAGVYSDNAGAPNALLSNASCTMATPQQGWAVCNFPANVSVTAGTTYWLAILPLGGNVTLHGRLSEGNMAPTSSGGITDLPTNASGASVVTGTISVAVLGQETATTGGGTQGGGTGSEPPP